MKSKKILAICTFFVTLLVLFLFLNLMGKDFFNKKDNLLKTEVDETNKMASSETYEYTTPADEEKSSENKTSAGDVSDDNVSENKTSVDSESNNGENFNIENEQIEVLASNELTEPGKGALDIGKIAGFIPGGSYDNNSQTETIESGIALSVSDISVEAVGGYTGNYVEDGSDEPIENVAAIIVTNNSSSVLQVADIEFKVNETDTAKFRVTNIVSGASVLVLEASKRSYSEDDDYSYGTVATAWLDSVSMCEDKFEIEKKDGLLSLRNKTNNTYSKVYVYYKYIQVGGSYMGGITYRVPFENICANTTIESVANHFNESTSRIVDVQIVE